MKGPFARAIAGAGSAALIASLIALPSAHASTTACGGLLQPACPPPAPAPPPPPAPTPAPPAPAPTPLVKAGATYVGRDGTHWVDFVAVTKDGHRVRHFSIDFQHGHCGDGEPYFSDPTNNIRSGAVISHTGKVSYSDIYKHAFFPTRRGKIVHGTERVTLKIQFSAGRLRGVLHDTFRSRHLSCSSGAVHFAGYPEGSSRAPLHNATTTTGMYRGLTSQSVGTGKSVRRVSAFVYLPLRQVLDIHIGWTAYCGNGYSFQDSMTVRPLEIHGSRFTWHASATTHADKQGLYSKLHARLSGQLAVNYDNRYSMTGTWRWSQDVYRAGHKLGSCTTGPVTFTAYGPGHAR